MEVLSQEGTQGELCIAVFSGGIGLVHDDSVNDLRRDITQGGEVVERRAFSGGTGHLGHCSSRSAALQHARREGAGAAAYSLTTRSTSTKMPAL